MKLEPWIYATLLVATLGLAWQSFKQDAPAARESITIFDPPKAVGISEVRWEKGDESVAVAVRDRDKDERDTWITATRRQAAPEAAAADHLEEAAADHPEGDGHDHGAEQAAPADEATAPGGELVTRTFPGNERAAQLIAAFEPFTGLRRFDAPTETALEEMGFSASTEALVLTSGERQLRFTVGETAYGSDNLYLLDGAGVAYLVASAAVRPLKQAEKSLLARDPLGVAQKEIVAIGVTGEGGGATLIQQGRHDRANAYFSLPDAPEERRAALDGLVEQLLGLRIKAWPADGDDPGPITPVVGAVIVGEDFKGDPRRLPAADALLASPGGLATPGVLGALQLGRGAGEGEPWFIRSGRTKRWVPVEDSAASDLGLQVAEAVKE